MTHDDYIWLLTAIREQSVLQERFIVAIDGRCGSGKTTLALHCIAEGQKKGGCAAFIDVEHALDPVYA